MPGVACDWLSETAIVLNGSATPPAAVDAGRDASAESSRWFRLHGIVPVHVEAMPTIGPSSRAGSMPIARKCARAPARSAPVASASRARRRSASWVTRTTQEPLDGVGRRRRTRPTSPCASRAPCTTSTRSGVRVELLVAHEPVRGRVDEQRRRRERLGRRRRRGELAVDRDDRGLARAPAHASVGLQARSGTRSVREHESRGGRGAVAASSAYASPSRRPARRARARRRASAMCGRTWIAGSSSTARRTRSGCAAASSSTSRPPNEWPTQSACVDTERVERLDEVGDVRRERPGGSQPERPWPRRSGAITRNAWPSAPRRAA